MYARSNSFVLLLQSAGHELHVPTASLQSPRPLNSLLPGAAPGCTPTTVSEGSHSGPKSGVLGMISEHDALNFSFQAQDENVAFHSYRA